MFGFKKKKKRLPYVGSPDETEVKAPAQVQRKSSRGSILSFGKKTHKSKTSASGSSVFYTTGEENGSETGGYVAKSNNVTGNDGSQNTGSRSRYSDAPGFEVLGRLASDLEALQLRGHPESKKGVNDRQSERSTSYASSSEGIAAEEGLDHATIIPAQDWGEQDVLTWLRENNLDYFVDLFDGCGIDGDYLLQITEKDLVELEVDDAALRERFLSAVGDLMDADEDDIDVSLPGLRGTSGSEWESVDEFDDDHGQTSSDCVTAVDPSQGNADLVRPPTGFSQGHQSRIGKVIDEWGEEDVITWLETIKLGKYATNFCGHRITGSKLKNIDMTLLDQMGITCAGDRERLLSSLYDLTQGSADNEQLFTSIEEASDYDKQKYLAAVSVMQAHSPRVQIIPAEPPGARPEGRDSVCSTSSESDSHQGRTKKKKKGSITKLRDAISGMSSKSSPSLVRVWTDVGKAKDKPIRLKLELEDTDTAKGLVALCLDSMSMIEDPRLYCIAEVLVADDKDRSTVTDRVLEDRDRPLKAQRKWRENLSGHFELRQRTAQGGVIKLVLKLPGEQPKGKLVALSLSTPTKEMVPLALLKYGMIGAAPMDFCLLEVAKNGDLHPVEDDTLLLQQESHAYVLCMKGSVAELTNSNETSHLDEDAPPGSTRRSSSDARRTSDSASPTPRSSNGGQSLSLGKRSSSDVGLTDGSTPRGGDGGMSRLEGRDGNGGGRRSSSDPGRSKDSGRGIDGGVHWSKQSSEDDGNNREMRRKEEERDRQQRPESRTSLTSSHSSLSLKVDGEKLTQLEQEMASIEQSLQPKVSRSVSWDSNVENEGAKKMVIPTRLEGLDSPDDRLAGLEAENSCLRERLQEFGRFEEIFGKLKSTLTRLNTDTNMKLLERRRASNPDLDSLPRDLAAPMFQLEGLSQEVEVKQARVNELREKLEKSGDDTNSSYLKLEEASLISLKLEQTRLLCVVEVAMADYQLSCVKRKELAENRSLITILPPNKPFTIVGATMNAGEDGYQFELGSIAGRKGIFISKCEEDGTMRRGDRVIEINNHSMFTSSVAEGNTKLNSTSRAKLVLLRDQVEQDEPTVEDLAEELAATNRVLTETDSKNEALTAEITQLRSELAAAKSGNISPNLSSPNHKMIEHRDLGAILENLDDDIPLWEAIKSHTKSEILQVFQEEIQEANRQKQYLDQLYTLMLQRAPDLLDELEQDFGAESEISGDEEFC